MEAKKQIVFALSLLAVTSSSLAAPKIKDRVVADHAIDKQAAESPGAEGGAKMHGLFEMPLADGGFASLEFIADANGGFQPQSEILPQAHPLPEHVSVLLRIVEQQRAEGITFDNQGRRV